jgi:uncharacterized SAM-binding protein YcdF (DUF218 family)
MSQFTQYYRQALALVSKSRLVFIPILALAFGFFLWQFAVVYSTLSHSSPIFWEQEQSADCGLVLTGGPQRVREGFDLLARGQIQKLIVSGVNPSAHLFDIFPMISFHGRIREENVILEKKSQTTYGNAHQSAPLVEALGCRDVVLITSNLHMMRALKTLRAELPLKVAILPRSVASSVGESTFVEILTESTKVLFYSVWAY